LRKSNKRKENHPENEQSFFHKVGMNVSLQI
jgi:hypothetical protein